MLGQVTMFASEEDSLPLRRRVTLQIVPLSYVRGILKQHHYLHRCRVGRQINYAVYIDGVVDGVITYAYPMTSAAIDGIPSDEVIEFARLYLHHNIPHSATCAIGKSLARVAADWMTMFPTSKVPRMVVSWSDKTKHTGTVYKASNFVWLRISKHSGLGHHRGVGVERTKHADMKNEKDCWVYHLKPSKLTHKTASGR